MTKLDRDISPFVRAHYLGRFLSKIPTPAVWRGCLVAVATYLLFLIAALLTGWRPVLGSFLHIWQISLSITMLLSAWFGETILSSIEDWLEEARSATQLAEPDFMRLSHDTLDAVGSKASFAFALLFIGPGMAVGLTIASSMPNNLFPFSGVSPAFIYSVIFQFCLVMLLVLGASGFWVILFVFARAADKLSQMSSVNYDLLDDYRLRRLSKIVLHNCILLLIVLASAMPCVAYVGFSFENTQVRMMVAIFGMLLPTAGLTVSFFLPTYHLSKMVTIARYKRVLRIRKQLRICEAALERRVMDLSTGEGSKLDPEYKSLSELSEYLHQRLKETRSESTWPLNISSIIQLGGSSLLPIFTFFIERILKSLTR